jgi:hypothetical protein
MNIECRISNVEGNTKGKYRITRNKKQGIKNWTTSDQRLVTSNQNQLKTENCKLEQAPAFGTDQTQLKKNELSK